MLDQIAHQQHAVRHRPVDDMRGVRGEIQRLAPGTRMPPHQALPHRWHRGALLVGELGKPDLRTRVKDRMLGDERLYYLLHRLRQRVIGRAHVSELGLAVAFRARRRDPVRVEHRQRPRHMAERGVGVPQAIAERVHAAPVTRRARPVVGVEVRDIGEFGVLQTARAAIGLRRLDRPETAGKGELALVIEALIRKYEHRMAVDCRSDLGDGRIGQIRRQIHPARLGGEHRMQLSEAQTHRDCSGIFSIRRGLRRRGSIPPRRRES